MNIETLVADAQTLGERFPHMADGILLDAPCSGLGILRRRPELRWQKRRTDVEAHFPHLQDELLDGVANAVKPGGTLVYAVCTNEPEETDQRVIAFLHRHPEFALVHASFSLPPAAVELTDRLGLFRTWPHREGMDGFFAAKLVRESLQ
ncbi:MAG: hypothetical protein HYZ73_01975 [Elusimicrobia bacterium]|nr:hypothetical protein [Elusimicrobiota bacterium]